MIQIWFKLVKVYQARTVQGPNKMLEEFQDVGFLEEQQGGHESKKSVLLRHERAMQMPEHADCIEIFWLQSPCTCYLFGLFINPLTWSSHPHVAHVAIQFIWGDSTFARIELHLSHSATSLMIPASV